MKLSPLSSLAVITSIICSVMALVSVGIITLASVSVSVGSWVWGFLSGILAVILAVAVWLSRELL